MCFNLSRKVLMGFLFGQVIEEEAAKRIELLVKKRVEEELEKRKDEIELEVTKRVEAAKKQMEREMMIELEKRREQAREEERKREVSCPQGAIFFPTHRNPYLYVLWCPVPKELPRSQESLDLLHSSWASGTDTSILEQCLATRRCACKE